MNRREVIKSILAFSAAGVLYKMIPEGMKSNIPQSYSQFRYSLATVTKFDEIINKGNAKEWNKLPIGECIGKVALELIGTPYVGNTLEGDGPEVCRINLSGMDCVTFFEASLCFARVLKKGKKTFGDFVDEVTFTRYRSGLIDDYTSRLHYTADWIYDNKKKGVIKDMTKQLGGVKFPINVFFMSRNPNYYQALKENPEYVTKIENIEKEINKRDYFYIKKNLIQKTEKHFQTGDIIAITTNKEGLDYSHTGLIIKSEDGIPHFVHASLKQKKVIIDVPISKYVQSVKSDTGITVLRPVFDE